MASQPSISGPAALALASLNPAQVKFIRALPKAELHAHLNGSIPLPVLQKLFKEHLAVSSDAVIQAGVERLEQGVVLAEIGDFFRLFPAIYALTSTPPALRTVAHAVLSHFLDPADDGHPECTYLELRTGPRATPHMTRREYLEAVLDEVERYSPDAAALIVSIDRAIPDVDMEEVVKLAIALTKEGRRVVGLDLSGDPFAGDVQKICQRIQTAKEAGLCVTLHIAETDKNPDQETADFLETRPDRLGHATFLDHQARQRVIENKIGVELCLSSNLLCGTVKSLKDHHVTWYLERKHPVAISACTDDILPFRTSLTAEYALLLADSPLGLGLGEEEVQRIAETGLRMRFS